jgi:hypothetical protein
VENVDGHGSSSDGDSGNLRSNTKNVFDEGLFCQYKLDQGAKTKHTRKGLSMKSGTAASETHGRLTKSTDKRSPVDKLCFLFSGFCKCGVEGLLLYYNVSYAGR